MYFDLRKKKVLIVDDFASFRLTLKNMVESMGSMDIDSVKSGESAIKHMRSNSYDIVLCDYNLGEGYKDGQQVLEEARHRNLIRHSTIFIMLTAENTSPMVMGAVEYQPDDYLIKPITKEILQIRIEKLIRQKEDFEDIEKAVNNKEYLRAITLCDDRVKNRPQNTMEYLRLKSELAIKIGRYEDALSVFEEVLEIRELAWAKMGMGKAHFLTGDFLKAKNIFEEIIDENKAYMEAYDWLAKTLEELGSDEEAQKILLEAIEISPKSILRHKNIADISLKLNDLDTAEVAYQSAIDIGRNSCFKAASDYTGLAKVHVKKNSSQAALSILNDARNEFKGDHNALLETAITESMTYKSINKDDKAKKALEKASKQLKLIPGEVPTELIMDMSKVCFELGDNEKGLELLQDVVRNNHDNEKVLDKVGGIFKDADMEQEGAKIISSIKGEIINLNNAGVKLVQHEQLDEAVTYFEKAAEGLPGNKIIISNAAQALLMHIQKNGKNDDYLFKASEHLERLRKIDPSDETYKELLTVYESISVAEEEEENKEVIKWEIQ